MIDGLPGSCAIPDLPDVFCRFGDDSGSGLGVLLVCFGLLITSV
ncbi:MULTISPECIES: hypothetical protein [unclassified Ensifer]|nr:MULTISPECIES: hypothetical protein [unclassified Ensifer]